MNLFLSSLNKTYYYKGLGSIMPEETLESDEEFLEEEEEEEEESRDWGKIGIAMLFFLVVIIGYYIIQGLS